MSDVIDQTALTEAALNLRSAKERHQKLIATAEKLDAKAETAWDIVRKSSADIAKYEGVLASIVDGHAE